MGLATGCADRVPPPGDSRDRPQALAGDRRTCSTTGFGPSEEALRWWRQWRRGPAERERPSSTAGRRSSAARAQPRVRAPEPHRLRAYRQRSPTGEESRVSYWRRLIQARLDVIAARRPTCRTPRGRLGPRPGRAPAGRPRRGASRRGRSRSGLVPARRRPAAARPRGAVGPRGPPATTPRSTANALRADLRIAELQLSAYRAALHRGSARPPASSSRATARTPRSA